MFRDADLDIPIHSIGVPLRFIEHSKRGEILSDLGMTAQNIARDLVSWSSAIKDQSFTGEKQHLADENENRRQPR